LNYARDYCNDLSEEGRPRYPVPEADIAITPTSRPRSNASVGTATPDEQAVEHSPIPDGSALLDLMDQERPPPLEGAVPSEPTPVQVSLSILYCFQTIPLSIILPKYVSRIVRQY